MRDRARCRHPYTGVPAVSWSYEQLVRCANVPGAPGNSPRRPGWRSRHAARCVMKTPSELGYSAQFSSTRVVWFIYTTTHFFVGAHLYYPPGVCRPLRRHPSARIRGACAPERDRGAAESRSSVPIGYRAPSGWWRGAAKPRERAGRPRIYLSTV